MDVTIQEKKFSLRAEYDIVAPDKQFTAQKALLSWPAKIELAEASGDPIATLQAQFSPIHNQWEFRFADGRNYLYRCEKVWKGTYLCTGNAGETYRLYQHHGLQFSILRDDRQIAAFQKNHFVIGDGNRFEIRMNSDGDVALLVSMVLALNTSDGDDDNKETATYDFGNIGPQDRKFDESWQPT